MIFKVDYVRAIEEVTVLSNFNTQQITLTSYDPVSLTRYLNSELFNYLKDVQFQGKLGFHYNPHLISIEECTKVIDTGQIHYIQIDYSQLAHPHCKILHEKYLNQVTFVCDSVIADSDSEPGWVQLDIEDANNWGCDLVILNLFSDRQQGWSDFISGNFDLQISDLENWFEKYKIGICCDFKSADVQSLYKYPNNLAINLKIHEASQHGHFHTFSEVTTLLTMLTLQN